MNIESRMYSEAAQAPAAVRTQLHENAERMQHLGRALRDRAPRAVVTCARGSSDHAATYAKYLIEARTQIVTSSAAPSLSSVYEARADLQDVLFLAISQSGRSPDLIAATTHAKAGAARVIALCNSPDSPLMQLADHPIALHAGAETSVAATKSYIASLSAIAHLLGHWTTDEALLNALAGAPDLLARSWLLDWSAAIPILQPAHNLFVVGRGFGLGIAQEAALKLKETCRLHAEAFSAAEIQHGPMALVREGFPVLMFSQNDETRAGIESLAADLAARGARVLLAGAQAPGAITLPSIAAHPLLEPLLMIQSFYRMVTALAAARGLNPDVPPHLQKVTETL